MNQLNKTLVGAALVAAAFMPLMDAHAWVAAAGGYRGGAVAVGGFHPAYHPAYHPAGCYGCGAAAGAVAGMAVGAAVASAARPTAAVVVVAQPAVVVAQPTYVVQGNMPLGTQIAAVPAGSRSMVVNGVNYYQSGATWFKPYFGSSGVYYEVVQTP